MRFGHRITPRTLASSFSLDEHESIQSACTIVVPTYDEADNVRPLLTRLKTVFADITPVEILFVDDSPDDRTMTAVQQTKILVDSSDFEAHVYYRTGSNKWGGLGGAVTDGIRRARYPNIIVMDGDLQHPPELAPELLKSLQVFDIAIASRYIPGGSAGGLDGRVRHAISKGASMLAKAIFPRALQNVNDPMTGFFALRRHSIDLGSLQPNGFKILLEILARHPHLNCVEVPLDFGERAGGSSKATANQGITYIRHLCRLRCSTVWNGIMNPPRALKFAIVGGSVFIFGLALLFVLVEYARLNPILANGIQLAVTFLLNFLLNKRYTWSDRTVSSAAAVKFIISRGLTAIMSFYLFAILIAVQISVSVYGTVTSFSIHYLAANIITLLVAMSINYALSDKWVFKHTTETPAVRRPGFGWLFFKGSVLVSLYIVLMYLIFGSQSFVAALLATASILLFAQASMEVWRMLYSYREPDAVDKMKFPEPAKTHEKFCLIVPARHEEEVLQTTLEQLDRQTHPEVTILPVVCHDDPETLAVAQAAADNSERIFALEYTRPQGVKPSKPLQLNFALEWMRGRGFTVVGVFDAEDTVHPDLLRHVDAAFQDDETQIVQGGVQLMNYDRRWFTLHNVLEYWKWFSSVMQFQANQRFVPLGGNTVFIRYDLLETAGGWPLSLTEDCALGVLLSTRYQAKTSTFYDPRLATREEAPETLHGLFFQRVRWMQGFYKEWVKCVWRELPTRRQRFIALYVLANPTFQAAAALMIPISFFTIIMLKAPVGLVMLMYLPMVPLVLQLLLNVVYLHDFGRAFSVKIRLRDYFNLIFMHFPYQLILNLAALWALIREFRGESSWHKTKHSGAHRAMPLTEGVVS